MRMKITADDEKLLVGDNCGHLKLTSLIDGEVIKNCGRFHHEYISGIKITVDQKFLFTSLYDGVLKQWNYEDNSSVRDHGQITDNYIVSLCL
jgi:WD40 repeat protein